MLRVAAPAKVNLYLHIGGRRGDGYHELESLVCFAEAGDLLCFAKADALSLSVDGPFAAGLAGEGDNLILRAGRALAAAAGITAGAAITLTKTLPVASGIGGGSADAAAALRGLVTLWDMKIEAAALHDIALSLGSDVPVCVTSLPALMTGRGEHLRAAGTLPPMPMLLVNPGVAVSTGEVFRRLGRSDADTLAGAPPLPSEMTPAALLAYLAATRNDLEGPAREIAPVIGIVLDALRAQDARLARMCGSGATCYALFDSEAAAADAGRRISAVHPAWWVQATRIAGPGIAA